MNSAGINWTKLFNEGRVKAIGVPWSDEDNKALASGVSVEDVRKGILRKEDKEAKEAKMTPLERMKRDELIVLAKEKGISFDENVVTDGDLILLLKAEEEKKEYTKEDKEEDTKDKKMKYQDFVKEKSKEGIDLKQIGVLWQEYKKVD